MRRITLGVGLAVGYLAGSRAGRGPYLRTMALLRPMVMKAWTTWRGYESVVDLTIANGDAPAMAANTGARRARGDAGL